MARAGEAEAERYRRYTTTDIHWRLIAATEDQRAMDSEVDDGDGFVNAQALFCPYYVTLEGHLGGDWGVIVNPESRKFGRLVFEHEWCGCPVTTELGESVAVHGAGTQTGNDWRVEGCRSAHTFRDGRWGHCHRPKGHKGAHQDRDRTWRG